IPARLPLDRARRRELVGEAPPKHRVTFSRRSRRRSERDLRGCSTTFAFRAVRRLTCNVSFTTLINPLTTHCHQSLIVSHSALQHSFYVLCDSTPCHSERSEESQKERSEVKNLFLHLTTLHPTLFRQGRQQQSRRKMIDTTR